MRPVSAVLVKQRIVGITFGTPWVMGFIGRGGVEFWRYNRRSPTYRKVWHLHVERQYETKKKGLAEHGR